LSFKLYAHQKQVLEIARKRSYGIFLECGTGKTLVGICLARHFKTWPVKTGRTLVVAPLSLLWTAWSDDLAKFAPELKTCILWGRTPKHREKLMAEAAGADIAVTNFETFKKIAPWCRGRFDVLIVDESSKMKDPRSAISRALTAYGRTVPKVYPMSGTPMPNNAMELYPQVDVIAPGLLGSTFWNYRARWFAPHGKIKEHVFDWRPLPGAIEEIMNLVKPYASFVKKQDCLDLPEKVFVARKFALAPKVRAAYDKMVEDKVLPLTNGQSVLTFNALSEIAKLRQLGSGWIYGHDGKVNAIGPEKLDLLEEVLDEIGPQRVIIWVQYRHDAAEIEKRLGNQARLAIGGMTPSDLVDGIGDFKTGAARYLIAHPRTVGHGVTLTECSYAVYYSLSYSLEEFLQSQDRIHRIGAHEKCTYITLLAEDTVDEAIYKALIRKEDTARETLSYLRAKVKRQTK